MVTLCSGRRTVSANAETLAKQVAAVGAKFMMIRSASDANWSNLCTFLGCGVPFAPYPALPKAVLKFPLDHGNGEPLRFPKTKFLKLDFNALDLVPIYGLGRDPIGRTRLCLAERECCCAPRSTTY